MSSVIAVVLMVALTIVLAASVGVFVLGIGQEATNQAQTPNVKYATEFIDGSTSDSLSITVKGGDTVKAANLEIIIDGTTAWKDGSVKTPDFSSGSSNWPAEVKSGETLTLKAGNKDIDDGDRLMIVWKNGDTSTILLDRTI
ncbi:MAG TPA: type IV pilin N-terminal domain-containing protein [Natrialbaceae archaeon]|nr:type IV pilin N-terminal domain-containing protein [Natrialbaceae archaeon]